VPLFDALNQLCDTMRLHWTRETSGATAWLQFRSASFFHDRLKEVPNRLLARWATSRKEHGSLSLDELIEIAQLPDAQLDATEMAEGAQQIWGLAEWGLARGHGMRPHLRFLATASPAQRQAATGPDGLAFTKMTLAQQQQFIALLSSGPGGRPPGGPAPTLEELAGTALRVDYAQAGSYEWRRPQGDQPAVSVREARGGRPSLPPPAMFEPAPVRERTREAALQAARRVDPGATEAQITTPTQPGLLVQIMTSGPEGRMPMMTLHAGGGA
jgi:hypothetical protein